MEQRPLSSSLTVSEDVWRGFSVEEGAEMRGSTNWSKSSEAESVATVVEEGGKGNGGAGEVDTAEVAGIPAIAKFGADERARERAIDDAEEDNTIVWS